MLKYILLLSLIYNISSEEETIGTIIKYNGIIDMDNNTVIIKYNGTINMDNNVIMNRGDIICNKVCSTGGLYICNNDYKIKCSCHCNNKKVYTYTKDTP